MVWWILLVRESSGKVPPYTPPSPSSPPDLEVQASELGVGAQAVEVVGCILLAAAGRLAETGGNLVERAALGLGHLEVREDEEAQQQHSEDDEDVGPTQFLQRHRRSGVKTRHIQ